MERSDGSDKMAVFREVGCSLLMFIFGILFCLLLATLAYCSYHTVVEGMTSCTLWVDIPGRLAIFVTCYYIASMCGFCPLPRQCYLNKFIEPFHVWRLESWRRLFRIICFPTLNLLNWFRRKAEPARSSLETPLLRENSEESYLDDSQRRRQSEPIDIRYPKSYIAPVFVSNPEATPRNESPAVKTGSDGSIPSVSSSIGDLAVPIMAATSSNQHYISDVSITPEDRPRVSTKYRKRYTEIKWTEEVAVNLPLPVAYDHDIVSQRRAMPTLDKKSAILTDDERIEISREERLRLAIEMPQVHMNAPVLVPRLSRNDYALSRGESERLLEEKSILLTEDEKLVAMRDQEMKNEMLKACGADGQFRIPTATTELLPETTNQPAMYGQIQLPEGTILGYKVKSPPKYSERHVVTKEMKVPTSVQDVKSEQPRVEKYFEPTDDGRHSIARLQEQARSNERRHLRAAEDEQLKAPISRKPSIETENQTTVHCRNQQPGRATTSNEQEIQPKVHDIETQLNFPAMRNRNQKPVETTCNPEKVHSTETSNFPRFPWYTLRDPKGVTAGANRLHKRNLEREKREIERYSMRQRNQAHLNRLNFLNRNHLVRLRSTIITETQLPGSSKNISPKSKSSFQKTDFSTKSPGSQAELRPNTGLDIGKDKIGLTKNRYKMTQNEEMEKIRATNQGPPLYLQRSDLKQRQEVDKTNADEVITRHRRLPSQRFQVKLGSLSKDKGEKKTDVKLVTHRREDPKDSGQKAPAEASKPDLSKMEQDTERTGTSGTATEEIPNENFNRLQLEGLRRRLVHLEHRTQTSAEASATVESKQNVDTKEEVKITQVCDEKSNESMRPSATGKQHVKITIDSSSSSGKSEDDSDSAQSKK